MNEFLQQFVLESRELAEQAVADLLALEERPDARERLDSAFRAFHTLKGGAGIVEFSAMERALHAAEDVLARVRSGAEPVSEALITNGLACLDQVLAWLDAIEAQDGLPADADQAADRLAARFRGRSPERGEMDAGWARALLASHPNAAAQARSAVRYAPERDSFFRGEDPLARLAALPGLLALSLSNAGDWPALDALDPFAAQLEFRALTSLEPQAVRAHLNEAHGEVQAIALAAPTEPAIAGVAGHARQILEEQVRLVAEGGAEGWAGRLGSAARVAANVLRRIGRPAEAAEVQAALERGLATREAAPLSALLQSVLDDDGPPAEPASEESAQGGAPRAVRVDVGRVDRLVTLVGELTVAKNAIGHLSRLAGEGGDPRLVAAALAERHAELDRLTGEVQQSVLALRVLPLRQLFRRFPRLIREMAAELGRPARLLIDGGDTEADRAVVDALFEPLLHLLRNAMDHGVEPPAERQAAGKPAIATIRLSAARLGEHVLVEVVDDGRGVDPDRVRQVAAERGLAPPDALSAMSDEDAIGLIFAAGFTTAKVVSGRSGRGVGMDAVREAVESLGGRVEIESRRGAGARVRLTLPFTVMMTRVLTLEAGGQAFGVPVDAVVETVRAPRSSLAPIGAARAFVLRERTIPVIDLGEALGQGRNGGDDADANLVIASVGGQIGALEVDRFGERLDVMLKPADGLLSGLPGIAGTTLLGDGRVLIVLDLQELIQ